MDSCREESSFYLYVFPSNLLPNNRSFSLQQRIIPPAYCADRPEVSFSVFRPPSHSCRLSYLLPQSLKRFRVQTVGSSCTAAPPGMVQVAAPLCCALGHQTYSICSTQSRDLLKNASQIPFRPVLFILEIVFYSFNGILVSSQRKNIYSWFTILNQKSICLYSSVKHR